MIPANSTVGEHSRSSDHLASLGDTAAITCPICGSRMDEAKLTPCGHVFCTECLELWLHERNTCPACRSLCYLSRLITLIVPYQSVLTGNTTVYCPYNTEAWDIYSGDDQGPLIRRYFQQCHGFVPGFVYEDNPALALSCKWNGKLKDICSHLNQDCEMTMKCPSPICWMTGTRSEMMWHFEQAQEYDRWQTIGQNSNMEAVPNPHDNSRHMTCVFCHKSIPCWKYMKHYDGRCILLEFEKEDDISSRYSDEELAGSTNHSQKFCRRSQKYLSTIKRPHCRRRRRR